MEAVIVMAIIFGTLFGIVYLFISARHKERLSLIEKGADASIFILQTREAFQYGKSLSLTLL